MAGEMSYIDETGKDSNGDIWPYHAFIARSIQGKLRPFDVYQGPYILKDFNRLWICSETETCDCCNQGIIDYGWYVYNELNQQKTNTMPYLSLTDNAKFKRIIIKEVKKIIKR